MDTAERAYRAYAEDDLARWQCTAGALDTDCIDKETAFALLLPGLDLYEITGDHYYLEQAEAAAYYLASWQWHYNLHYAPGTPAAAMGYATFGGTSVSVQHHHLDPWGALIALGWLRLGRMTGKHHLGRASGGSLAAGDDRRVRRHAGVKGQRAARRRAR